MRSVARIPKRAEELARAYLVGLSSFDYRFFNETLYRDGERLFLSTWYGVLATRSFGNDRANGRYLLTEPEAAHWWQYRERRDSREAEQWMQGEDAFDSEHAFEEIFPAEKQFTPSEAVEHDYEVFLRGEGALTE